MTTATQVLLPTEHISFSSSAAINDIFIPLKNYARTIHFAYAHVYSDGSCILLGNNAYFISDYLKKGYRITAPPPRNFSSKKLNYLVTFTGPHQQAMADAANLFNIGEIFNMLELFNIEAYLENIKNKLGVSKKVDVMKFMFKHDLLAQGHSS